MSALEQDAPRGFVSMRDYLKLQAKCDALEEKILAQQEDQADEASEVVVAKIMEATGLTRQQTVMMLVLARAKHKLNGRMLKERVGLTSLNAVSVVFAHIRTRLRARGHPELIAPIRAYAGYGLTPEARA